MSHVPLSPLAEKIYEYLCEYHDFAFHYITRFLKGLTQEEIIAVVDELELKELVDFVHHDPRDEAEKHLRKIDIYALEARAVGH